MRYIIRNISSKEVVGAGDIEYTEVPLNDPLFERVWIGDGTIPEITHDIAFKYEDDGSVGINRIRERPYYEKRRGEYPPMSEYLDAIVQDDKKAIQEYIDKCKAVKLKYPKDK